MLHNTHCKQSTVCRPLGVDKVHCIEGNIVCLFVFLVLFSPCTVPCFTWCVWCRCVCQPCRCSRGGRSPYERATQWTQSTSMGELGSFYFVRMCSLAALDLYLDFCQTADCKVVRKGISRWIAGLILWWLVVSHHTNQIIRNQIHYLKCRKMLCM